jgi:hypothetical protein
MYRLILTGILIASGLASGCSSTTLLYNNAPWVVSGKIDDYFSLSNSQEEQLDQDIEQLFKWHRRNELPEYATLISQFNALYVNGLTRQELVLLNDQITSARVRIARAMIDPASKFFLTVSDKQLDHFDAYFYQQLSERKKAARLSAEEASDANFDKLLDNLEDWFGNFDENQKAKLRLISDAMPNQDAERSQRREQRHREFLALLRARPERSSIKQYLYNRFVTRIDISQEQSEFRLYSRQQWQSAILEIDKLITAKQRLRAMDRLIDYRDDFITLSKQTEPKSQLEIENWR